MNLPDSITRDPAVCGGEPVFRGTKVTLRTVIASLAAGDSIEQILCQFPALTEQQVRAAIAFAAASAQHHLPKSQTAVKTFCRIIGTLAGLVGVVLLFPLPWLLSDGKSFDWPTALFFLLPTLIGFYLLYIGVRVWFQLAPRVVNQICGVLAFAVVIIGINLLRLPDRAGSDEPLWVPFVFLGGLAFIVWASQAAARFLNRRLFPDSHSPSVIQS